MLDTSALIGLHEADPEVATYLAGVLAQHDDGTVPKTHQVVLGDLHEAALQPPRRPAASPAFMTWL